jgi:hypothetical protein
MFTTTRDRSSLFDRSLPLKESSRNYLKFTHKKIMMKNKLKSIVLAIAVFAIVIVNNIGIGSFDRVDARPTSSTDGSQIQDIQTIPTTRRRNYPAALKYVSIKDRGNFINSIWNEGGKHLEQKLREALDGKQLDRGDRIYDTTIKLRSIDIDQEEFSFDPTTNTGRIIIETNEKIQFKTTNPATLGAERESTFLGEFGLRIEVGFLTTNQSSYSDDLIKIAYVIITNKNFKLDSNANDTTAAAVSRFCEKKFESVMLFNGYDKLRQRKYRYPADPSVTTRWAGYIESALQRTVPVNILLTR